MLPDDILLLVFEVFVEFDDSRPKALKFVVPFLVSFVQLFVW